MTETQHLAEARDAASGARTIASGILTTLVWLGEAAADGALKQSPSVEDTAGFVAVPMLALVGFLDRLAEHLDALDDAGGGDAR